jgi:hypothetical protein
VHESSLDETDAEAAVQRGIDDDAEEHGERIGRARETVGPAGKDRVEAVHCTEERLRRQSRGVGLYDPPGVGQQRPRVAWSHHVRDLVERRDSADSLLDIDIPGNAKATPESEREIAAAPFSQKRSPFGSAIWVRSSEKRTATSAVRRETPLLAVD